ncbi:AAA domain-containing protein [Deinococcus soli (ex Cha et al. 2016)]|uniref:Uncharacterized protein n=2 Tax=Deinococcus soli (ex Cha et al. 2016) TaxID=1309411 RepID=A0ACC6KGT7_9DEIO|nr:AAA domain-containing protein [Deinococcus soli (ex Cha et al. 2016)]MDR6218942.1 hypothetical protein [Deinococcus soli (ex Cha et al. 2016)]MDR6328739.1 hypothetical protein [Deinococcus soli (ex Cha et al. 2016)]MDR6751774.1 hypothetical protein [Deinococcus soli (ex Cha et al. 2016)]
MPTLSKKSMSLYFKNRCDRQLLLYLHSTEERRASGMPERQPARPSSTQVGRAGHQHGFDRVEDLIRCLGESAVIHGPADHTSAQFSPIDLRAALTDARAHTVLVEADFAAPDSFLRWANLDRTLAPDQRHLHGNVRPDLIQVLPAGYATQLITLDGHAAPLPGGDPRLQLRVVDIKMSSEPATNYFGEVAYYSLLLTHALHEWNLSDRFVVLPQAAVWPGVNPHGTLVQAAEAGLTDPDVLLHALHEDFEEIDLDLFTPRIRRFLHDDVPRVLNGGLRAAPWHANAACAGCEFFGHDWSTLNSDGSETPTWAPGHCKPQAETQRHLSRVAGLTRGMAGELHRLNIHTTDQLAALRPGSELFHGSPLRAAAGRLITRAQALVQGRTLNVPGDALSVALPQNADLRIHLDFELDGSTTLTAALALRARWDAPTGNATEPRDKLTWGDFDNRSVHLVTHKTLQAEQDAFLTFLRALVGIISTVKARDEMRRTASAPGADPYRHSRYQLYLWDKSQLEHLQRLVSRHLEAITADPDLRDLTWLFPSGDLLTSSADVTRVAPVTLLAPVFEAFYAIPQPHQYTLMGVMQHYGSRPFQDTWRAPHPGYRDELSSLIPGERIHELWDAEQSETRREQRGEYFKNAVAQKLDAMVAVTRNLERDLRESGRTSNLSAPDVTVSTDTLEQVAPDSQLWYQYHRLNASLAQFESEFTYCLPAEERVAKFKAAELRRIRHYDAQQAIDTLNRLTGLNMDTRDTMVFRMSDESRAVNLRASDIGLCLSARHQPGFLLRTLGSFPTVTAAYQAHRQALKENRPTRALPFNGGDLRKPLWQVMPFSVTIKALDRASGLIAFERPPEYEQLAHLLGFSAGDDGHPVMLDRLNRDFAARKIKVTLEAIGVPKGVNFTQPVPGSRPKDGPWVEFLWRAADVAATPAVSPHLAALEAEGDVAARLNPRQLDAWRSALTRRLTVIWGPPGTGKSKTLRSILASAVRDAELSGQPRTILVTAGTYTAVDNVLLDLLPELEGTAARVARVTRAGRDSTPAIQAALSRHGTRFRNVELDRWEPSETVRRLTDELSAPQGVLIIGAPGVQVHNLAYAGKNESTQKYAVSPWFDLVVLDEASQMDTLNSTLIFTKVKSGGRVVVAGDDKQLPPIHAAEKPSGFEAQLGSIYEYLVYQGAAPVTLNVNYRSNQDVVRVAHLAGYDQTLHAHSPGMRLNLLGAAPGADAPDGWPAQLPWTPDWWTLIDPDAPVTCVVYDDPLLSGQVNDFEASAAAAVAWLLRQHLAQGPRGQRGARGETLPASTALMTERQFWQRGLGVVAPHKAMVSRVADTLTRLFPQAPEDALRASVDTVERFQGQEREVMVAVFGLGDTELISAEAEFLFDLRRFNVMASRARTKLIVFVTRPLLDFMASDKTVLEQSGLLKRFAESHCAQARPGTLAYYDASRARQERPVTIRTAR